MDMDNQRPADCYAADFTDRRLVLEPPAWAQGVQPLDDRGAWHLGNAGRVLSFCPSPAGHRSVRRVRLCVHRCLPPVAHR